jgi:hypothetical protein
MNFGGNGEHFQCPLVTIEQKNKLSGGILTIGAIPKPEGIVLTKVKEI